MRSLQQGELGCKPWVLVSVRLDQSLASTVGSKEVESKAAGKAFKGHHLRFRDETVEPASLRLVVKQAVVTTMKSATK